MSACESNGFATISSAPACRALASSNGALEPLKTTSFVARNDGSCLIASSTSIDDFCAMAWSMTTTSGEISFAFETHSSPVLTLVISYGSLPSESATTFCRVTLSSASSRRLAIGATSVSALRGQKYA
jgi:hypothetical protein